MIARAPEGLSRVHYVSGGSEANETALKLARQYFLEIGQPTRHRFIARRQSYHGNTLGALAIGGNMWRRAPYEPLLIETSHISPCYAYRDQGAEESEAAYGRRVADELEAEILRLGPENVAAFIAEPVVGATAGALPAVPGYFKRIREICDTYGVLLILDEVMCGMGRTGTHYACAQEGVEPDLLRQAFPIATAGSVADGAELRIEHLPIQVRCLECGAETEAQANRLLCGVCGDYRTRLLSGDEMLLASVELTREAIAETH